MNAAATQSAIEAKVIGAVLANPDFYVRTSLLTEEAFLDKRCQTIWKIVQYEASRSRNVDPHSLAVRYPSEINDVGGLSYLDHLTTLGEQIATTYNDAVDYLYNELQWRRIKALGTRLTAAELNRERDPNQILASLQELTKRHLSGGRLSMKTKAEVAADAIADAKKEKRKTITGIYSLDLMMQGGLQPNRLYGVGAEFGRGKTILLGSISDNLNRQCVPHLFISLETPPEDIELRSCAKELGLNVASIHDTSDKDHMHFLADAESYLNAVSEKNHTYYDYSPQATIDEILRKILSAKSKFGIEGFILDYWQLIRGQPKGITRDDFLTDVSDRLASICRQEGIWGLVTAQVDENGRLKGKSDGLYQSCSLYIRLCREVDENRSWFVTEKSNYTPYVDNGNESISQMVFDDSVGPHFRNTVQTDIPDMGRGDEDDISV